MADADAMSRAELVATAMERYRQELGGPPEWIWFAPGRIEIFGKHTDYAGGRSLLCTVPRGIVVAARPRADRTVRVIDLANRERVSIDLSTGREPRPGLDNYASVVARRLALNFPDATLAADVGILSDLPRAAGVSSSSALVVGIASALIHRGRLEDRIDWRDNVATIDDKAWYLGCVENGLDYRNLPSSSGVGTLGGSEDHTAILACKAGKVSQYRFVPVQHINDVRLPEAWTFVVASSGVHADKAGGVRDLYNRASRATQVLLEIWNAHASVPAPSLGSVLEGDGSAEEELNRRIADGSTSGFPADALRTRLTHFARENVRIPRAARAVADGDSDLLAELAAESQRDADRLLRNQVPATRALVQLALASGAFAASAFGAGFGGSVWALVARQRADRFAERWLEEYRQAFPNNATAGVFVSQPGPALTQVPVPE
jgi:galactokinase